MFFLIVCHYKIVVLVLCGDLVNTKDLFSRKYREHIKFSVFKYLVALSWFDATEKCVFKVIVTLG